MDRLTEPLIGVRRSRLLSGWSGLEKLKVYVLAEQHMSPPTLKSMQQYPSKRNVLGYLKPLLQLGASSPSYVTSSIDTIYTSASYGAQLH